MQPGRCSQASQCAGQKLRPACCTMSHDSNPSVMSSMLYLKLSQPQDEVPLLSLHISTNSLSNGMIFSAPCLKQQLQQSPYPEPIRPADLTH